MSDAVSHRAVHRYTYRGRHRKPSALDAGTLARGAVATATVAAGVAVADLSAASAATANDFYRLRVCESGNNYRTNTGNGYYGAYQFALGTWRGLGYSGLPSNASPATQDEAARRLQARSGWGQWPACSARLGLRGGGGGTSAPATTSRASRSTARVSLSTSGAYPTYGGTALTARLVGQSRADVRAWQARMRQRGWPISVDGRFGRQSATIAQAFQRDKGLSVDGVVGPRTWKAAWTAPVT